MNPPGGAGSSAGKRMSGISRLACYHTPIPDNLMEWLDIGFSLHCIDVHNCVDKQSIKSLSVLQFPVSFMPNRSNFYSDSKY